MTAPAATLLVADIGGTGIKFGVVAGGEPGAYGRVFPTASLRGGDPVAGLAAMARAVITEAGIAPDAFVATVPGFLDADGDRVLSAANIPDLNGRRLASDLGALLAMPVTLERDSVMMLLGEVAAGCCRDARTALGLFFGTGVGAAFIEDGRPFRGAGWALEIGHMPFRGEGRDLPGMRRDSLETYVSGKALERIAGRSGVPIERVFDGFGSEGPIGAELAEFVRDQAFAIGTAAALFSPQVLVVGGGICAMPAFPRDPLARLVEANAPFRETGRRMDLRWAALGWQSVLHGAPLAAAAHAARRAG